MISDQLNSQETYIVTHNKYFILTVMESYSAVGS